MTRQKLLLSRSEEHFYTVDDRVYLSRVDVDFLPSGIRNYG